MGFNVFQSTIYGPLERSLRLFQTSSLQSQGMIIEIEKRARAPISPILGLIVMSTLDELLFNSRGMGMGEHFAMRKFY